jgi:hypothetical protein
MSNIIKQLSEAYIQMASSLPDFVAGGVKPPKELDIKSGKIQTPQTSGLQSPTQPEPLLNTQSEPPVSEPQSETEPSSQPQPQPQFDPNNPFPMPWQPGGSMKPKPGPTPVGPYSPTPGGVPPSKSPTTNSKPSQPQPQPQPQPQSQPQTPSERYRESQRRYEESRKAHGEFVNRMTSGGRNWFMGESYKFKKYSLLNLLEQSLGGAAGGIAPPSSVSNKDKKKGGLHDISYDDTEAPGDENAQKLEKDLEGWGGVAAIGKKIGGYALTNPITSFAVLPPSVLAATVTGRVGGTGFDQANKEEYARHLKNIITLGGGAQALAASIPGIGGTAAKYIDAFGSEGANLATAMYLDPRHLAKPTRFAPITVKKPKRKDEEESESS